MLCAPCKPVMPKPGCTPPPSRSSLGCVRTSHPGGSFPIAAVTPTFVTLWFCSSQARNGSHGAEIKVLAGPPSLRRLPGRSPVFASSRFWGLRVPCSRPLLPPNQQQQVECLRLPLSLTPPLIRTRMHWPHLGNLSQGQPTGNPYSTCDRNSPLPCDNSSTGSRLEDTGTFGGVIDSTDHTTLTLSKQDVLCVQ